jgi:Holliday junction DNA helicase RuvA
MIEFLAGTVHHRSPGEVVIECGGVGYGVHTSLNTFSELPDRGPVHLLIHHHFSESSQRLFGFLDESERALFRLLQGVRGIGPALALTLLSHEPPDALVARLKSGDVTGLTRIKGVGRKTAERLLVELRDRLSELAASSGRAATNQEVVLVQAMTNLGIPPSESELRARRVLAEAPGEPIEELLRLALKSTPQSRGTAAGRQS